MLIQAELPDAVSRTLIVYLASAVFLLLSACSVTNEPGSGNKDSRTTASSAPLWIEGTARPYKAVQDDPSLSKTLPATVTVRPGDRLSSISRRLTGSPGYWRQIAEYNNLDNPDSIKVGDVLKLPPGLPGREQDDLTPTDKSAGPLSLVAVLQIAQANDSTFRIAQTAYDIAQQDLPIAQSSLRPQANAGVSAGYTDLFDNRIDPYSDQQVALSLSQSLFDRVASKKVAQAKLSGSIAQIELHAQQEDLVIRVSEAYFDVLRNKAELEFRESDLDAIRRQLQQTQRRFDVGEIAVTDVAEARARFDLAVAARIGARNRLANSQELLAEITNLPTIIDLMNLQRKIPLSPPEPADIKFWLDSARQKNTQVSLARSRRELADEQVNVVRASRLPTVGLNGTLSSSNSGNELAQDGEAANVEIELKLPLLTGGLISSQVGQEKLRARQAAEQQEAAERSARRNTRAAFRDVKANISRVNALSQALVSTRLAATATRAGFDAGTRTSVELLTAQRDTFSARADYASARYDYLISVLQLKRSAGLLEADDILELNKLLQ